jgi:hypothetical protein
MENKWAERERKKKKACAFVFSAAQPNKKAAPRGPQNELVYNTSIEIRALYNFAHAVQFCSGLFA